MADMTVDKLVLADIPRGTFEAHGLSHLDIDWICAYLDQHLPRGCADAAWKQLIPQWLVALAGELEGDYEIRESENFTFLLPLTQQDSDKMVDEAERSLAIGLHGLRGISDDPGHGKHVVMCMASQDDYYTYYANYGSDGVHGASSGVCIRGTGYTHVVLNNGPEWVQRCTLSHEIIHVLLAHLYLPLWVEEGLVQIIETNLHDQGGVDIPVQDHRDYWREHTLAEYWLGSAFQLADEGQQLAYNLSRFMISDIMKEGREKFTAFVRTAHARDSGQSAAIEHLDMTLAQCLPPFLQVEFAPPR